MRLFLLSLCAILFAASGILYGLGLITTPWLICGVLVACACHVVSGVVSN